MRKRGSLAHHVMHVCLLALAVSLTVGAGRAGTAGATGAPRVAGDGARSAMQRAGAEWAAVATALPTTVATALPTMTPAPRPTALATATTASAAQRSPAPAFPLLVIFGLALVALVILAFFTAAARSRDVPPHPV